MQHENGRPATRLATLPPMADADRTGKAAIGSLALRLLRIAVAVLASLAFTARAADSDWIDELPTVTAVAHAVADQLKIDTAGWRFDVRGVALKDDDDLFAVYLVGTLVLLRQIILYKYQEEELSPQREAALRCAVAAYLEAELLIGQAVGKRRGYLTTAHKCKDMECYRRWFKLGIGNVRSASYRGRILPRLFSKERAAELDRLAQSYAVRAPYLPSPAETLVMEPEVAGLAPAGCSPYGGDANRNGLCDDWENPASAVGAVACRIVLERLRTVMEGGLRVALAKGGAQPGAAVNFRVLRAEHPVIDANAVEIWPLGKPGTAVIQQAQAPDAGLYAVVAEGVDLTPDPSRPYLVVEVTSAASAGPVHCEQPMPIWQQRQLDQVPPSGMHGPYPDLDRAVVATGAVALALTASNEAGFMVLRDMRPTLRRYFTTPPVPGPAPGAQSAGTIQNWDYRTSLENAFDGSCEDIANFAVAAWVHTHPEQYWGASRYNDNFSMVDFNFAIDNRRSPGVDFGSGLRIDSAFEQIYMINARNRCIIAFVPGPRDEPFTEEEQGMLDEAAAPFTSEHYIEFINRQRPVACYKPPA